MARALAKSPEDRFGTCRRFVAELRATGEPAVRTAGQEAETHPATQVDARLAGQWQGPAVSRAGALSPGAGAPPPPDWAAPVFPRD